MVPRVERRFGKSITCPYERRSEFEIPGMISDLPKLIVFRRVLAQFSQTISDLVETLVS